ncbi:hypothetical protein CPB86DRAFT_779746 [Serendipita vermifera]|nr:hypothetical protein CPB86DRAFT_779746 [Serendipita vermifera]
MKLLSKLNFLERQVIPGQRSKFERWPLALPRKAGFTSHKPTISLPPELWVMILWYVLEPAISPHTFCSSDTYPALNLQFNNVRRPIYGDWFRCRLVCRTWKNILGPYPSITCPSDIHLPKGEEELAGVTTIFINKLGPYVGEPVDPQHHPELANRVTFLLLGHHLDWDQSRRGIQLRLAITFRSLRCLCIGWISFPGDQDYWLTLSEGCPQLVFLNICGDINWSGNLSFPHLETLGVWLGIASRSEPSYNLPKLAHFSFTALFLPRQLLHKYGASLRSLLLHSSWSLDEITAEFWKEHASLQTFGIHPSQPRPIVAPPPDHPLRHLCIFLQPWDTQRIQKIQETLVSFPLIRTVSIEIPDPTRREKRDLLQLAKQSGFELQFLLDYLAS